MDTTCGNNGKAVGNSSELGHKVGIPDVIGGFQPPPRGGPSPPSTLINHLSKNQAPVSTTSFAFDADSAYLPDGGHDFREYQSHVPRFYEQLGPCPLPINNRQVSPFPAYFNALSPASSVTIPRGHSDALLVATPNPCYTFAAAPIAIQQPYYPANAAAVTNQAYNLELHFAPTEQQYEQQPLESIDQQYEQQPLESIDQQFDQQFFDFIEQQPLESIEQQPLQFIEQQPLQFIEQQPLESIEQQPLESIEQQPLQSIEQQPLQFIEQQPLESIEQQPVQFIEQQPLQFIEQQPLESIEQQPLQSIEQQPLQFIEQQPLEFIEQQPLESIEQQPLQSIEQQPLQFIEQQPLESIEQQRETPTAVVTEHPSSHTREQNLPPNTCDFDKRRVSSFVCFRVYYGKCLGFLPRKKDALKALIKIWHKDPFQSYWAVIARAYTLARESVGTKAASLANFVEMAVTIMNLPPRYIYLHHLGWICAESSYRQLRLSQDESMVERAKFLWSFEYSILAQKVSPGVSRKVFRDIPTMDVDLLNVCLAHGYLEGNHLEILLKIANQFSTLPTLGPSRVKTPAGGKIHGSNNPSGQHKSRSHVSKEEEEGEHRAQLRRHFNWRFVNLSAEDIAAGRTSARTAHGLDTTRS
nr:putative mating-type 1-1-1 protein [Ceratocystis harringtonii]WRK64980.1 putative mating-type 1-1-1 protein [Ceratocystis harringtonii]